MKRLLLGCSIAAFIGCAPTESTNRNYIKVLTLSEIMQIARSHYFDSIKFDSIKPETISNFDFIRLVPTTSTKSASKSLFTIYVDKKSNLRAIRKHLIDANSHFDFNVIKLLKAKASIMLIDFIKENNVLGTESYISGFLLNYNSNVFFIGFSEHPFCIMQLDADLNAVTTWRFCNNRLVYITKVNYDADKRLDSETFYEPRTIFEITGKTTFEEIINSSDQITNIEPERTTRVGWVDEERDLPLWIMGGEHEYDIAATPLPQHLPAWKLASNCMDVPEK